MTEEEWQECTKPEPLLKFLRDRASDRKFRLFACACCRRIDRLITDLRSRAALEFADRHVDNGVVRRKGRAKIERTARAAHKEAYSELFSPTLRQRQAQGLVVANALDAAAQTLNTDPFYAATYAAAFACYALAWEAHVTSGIAAYPDLHESFKSPEQAQRSFLVRDIFGNPFRPVSLDTSRLTETVRSRALIAYIERDDVSGHLAFDRLAILADALEEVGCDNASILDHLRGPGPHARGCWVLDLLLKKV